MQAQTRSTIRGHHTIMLDAFYNGRGLLTRLKRNDEAIRLIKRQLAVDSDPQNTPAPAPTAPNSPILLVGQSINGHSVLDSGAGKHLHPHVHDCHTF